MHVNKISAVSSAWGDRWRNNPGLIHGCELLCPITRGVPLDVQLSLNHNGSCCAHLSPHTYHWKTTLSHHLCVFPWNWFQWIFLVKHHLCAVRLWVLRLPTVLHRQRAFTLQSSTDTRWEGVASTDHSLDYRLLFYSLLNDILFFSFFIPVFFPRPHLSFLRVHSRCLALM